MLLSCIFCRCIFISSSYICIFICNFSFNHNENFTSDHIFCQIKCDFLLKFHQFCLTVFLDFFRNQADLPFSSTYPNGFLSENTPILIVPSFLIVAKREKHVTWINKKDYNYDEDKILEVMLESIKKDILEEQSC